MNLSANNQTDLYGLEDQFYEFVKLYNNKKLPNKILLSGQKSIGKCTLAYHLINFILSQNEEFSYNLENLTILKKINNYLLKNFKVDFTFLNIVSKNNMKKRLHQRKKLNRYDKFKNNFYKKVQNGFLKIAKRKKSTYQIINSNLSIKLNKKIIINKIDKLIK